MKIAGREESRMDKDIVIAGVCPGEEDMVVANFVPRINTYERLDSEERYLIGLEDDVKSNMDNRYEGRKGEENTENGQLEILQGYRQAEQEERREYVGSRCQNEFGEVLLTNEDERTELYGWRSKKEKWREKI